MPDTGNSFGVAVIGKAECVAGIDVLIAADESEVPSGLAVGRAGGFAAGSGAASL